MPPASTKPRKLSQGASTVLNLLQASPREAVGRLAAAALLDLAVHDPYSLFKTPLGDFGQSISDIIAPAGAFDPFYRDFTEWLIRHSDVRASPHHIVMILCRHAATVWISEEFQFEAQENPTTR